MERTTGMRLHQAVAPLHQLAPGKIAGHGAHHQQDQQGEQHPEAGDMEPSNLSGCQRPAGFAGLVQRADNPVEHRRR
jgi:hypothetical protein